MPRALPLAVLLLLVLAACGGGGGSGGGGLDDAFARERIFVDAVEFEVWVATTEWQHARGFQGVEAEEIAPLPDGTPRGMLFVFEGERDLAFWMRGTAVPLDLAYARADGTIVEVHELVPFDETPVPSSVPAQYALEAPAGALASRGIGPGSVIYP